MFIYFKDEDGIEYGIPVSSVVELKFTAADKEDSDSEDALNIEASDGEYEISGKAARQAWDDIKIQVKELSKQQGWRVFGKSEE